MAACWVSTVLTTAGGSLALQQARWACLSVGAGFGGRARDPGAAFKTVTLLLQLPSRPEPELKGQGNGLCLGWEERHLVAEARGTRGRFLSPASFTVVHGLSQGLTCVSSLSPCSAPPRRSRHDARRRSRPHARGTRSGPGASVFPGECGAPGHDASSVLRAGCARLRPMMSCG